MADSISTQLKKGVLDLCVLSLLARGDSYAYDIARNLAEAIDMSEGTIYPLMRRLQAEDLVDSYLQESTTGPPRKYYRIKERGLAALLEQKKEWQSFIASVTRILGDTP